MVAQVRADADPQQQLEHQRNSGQALEAVPYVLPPLLMPDLPAVQHVAVDGAMLIIPPALRPFFAAETFSGEVVQQQPVGNFEGF
jgi:hypothetical protein